MSGKVVTAYLRKIGFNYLDESIVSDKTREWEHQNPMSLPDSLFEDFPDTGDPEPDYSDDLDKKSRKEASYSLSDFVDYISYTDTNTDGELRSDYEDFTFKKSPVSEDIFNVDQNTLRPYLPKEKPFDDWKIDRIDMQPNYNIGDRNVTFQWSDPLEESPDLSRFEQETSSYLHGPIEELEQDSSIDMPSKALKP